MLFIASGVRVRCQEKYSQAIGGNTARFCLTYSFYGIFWGRGLSRNRSVKAAARMAADEGSDALRMRWKLSYRQIKFLCGANVYVERKLAKKESVFPDVGDL